MNIKERHLIKRPSALKGSKHIQAHYAPQCKHPPVKLPPSDLNKAKADFYLALDLYVKGEIHQAVVLLNNSLKPFRNQNCPNYHHAALIELGRIYISLGELEKGLHCYQVCHSIEKVSVINQVKHTQALIQLMLEFRAYSKCLKMLLDCASKLSMNHPDERPLLLEISLEIARVLGLLNQSKKQHKIILKVAKNVAFEEDLYLNMLVEYNLAMYYRWVKQVDIAQKHFELAKSLSESLGHVLFQVEISLEISTLLILNQEFLTAKDILLEAWNVDAHPTHILRKRLYYQLIQVYDLLGWNSEKIHLEQEDFN